jgi:P27 family predicted phage terminase small subunit
VTAAKPTRLKLIQGVPGGQKIHDDEPQPPIRAKVPRAPSHLTPKARKFWHKMAPQLHAIGLLTKVDETELEALCEAYARWREACDQVEEFGPLIKTPSGYPVQAPYIQIANTAFTQMQKCLTEFGLTPSSRTKIRGEK